MLWSPARETFCEGEGGSIGALARIYENLQKSF